jgi:hypothetical protein
MRLPAIYIFESWPIKNATTPAMIEQAANTTRPRQPLKSPHKLRDGDRFAIGHYIIVAMIDGQDSPESRRLVVAGRTEGRRAQGRRTGSLRFRLLSAMPGRLQGYR